MKTSINILSPHPVYAGKNFDQHWGRFVWGRFDRETWGSTLAIHKITPGDVLVWGRFDWTD